MADNRLPSAAVYEHAQVETAAEQRPTVNVPLPSEPSEPGAAPAAPPADAAAAKPVAKPVKATENGTKPAAKPKPANGRRSPRTMRERLARLGRSNHSNPVLEPLLRIVRATHPKADLVLIERAYRTAEKFHKGQTRKSGDPFITHPVAVATILAELGMTPPTLCAALLHDTVEDTPYTIDELRGDFGDEIAYLVDGVTKLDKVKYGQHAQAETIRKMVIAMARDIRVLVIKLADRLHNMRTLRYLKQAKQERIAQETLDIYASLAHRLGMNTLKWEIEDLAFATLHPKLYDEIVRLVAERAPSRDEYLQKVIDEVDRNLQASKIRATVTGRPKHYYSIYQKMIVRGREFGDIYDLVGIRVLTDSVRDCYAALGVLHGVWNPVPGRFKDYIAMPKFNMYQSLHTTVIGLEGKPVEIQIRTKGMHRRAEYGVAAHWKYKEDSNTGRDAERTAGSGPNDMSWLRQLLDWQKETEDPKEFLESLQFEMSANQVYVFTPKGDVLDLPAGSTPIDFAYAIHTDVGHRCIGARVNGRLVPLESTLENGDMVDVLTSKAENAGPSRDWQDIVQSPKAKNKIRQWFTKERREEAIEHGKDLLTRMVRKEGLPLQRALSNDAVTAVAAELNLPDVAALYAALGEGNITVQSVLRRLVESLGTGTEAEEVDDEGVDNAMLAQELRRRDLPRGTPGVEVKDAGDVWIKLARCCTPVPGDPIVGFVTRGDGVSVHRRDCHNIGHLAEQPERIVEVHWSPTAQSLFLVQIQVEALDRARLLSDITRVLSDQHVNILSASVVTTRDRVAKSRFTFEMGDPKHLGHVLRAVRGVDGVFDAYRVTN